MPYPLDTFVEATTSVWGRAFSFVAVICAAGFCSFGLSLDSVGYLPVVMVASVWAGWGIILYPILLVGFTLYITLEVSPLWLILVFILCYIDFHEVLNGLQDLAK
jgi:hypothetical protein